MEKPVRPPMSWLTDSPDGAILNLRIIPRASKNAIQGLHGDALKIRLCAPPVDGAANQALEKFLSKTAKIPRSQIEILSGATGRNKRVRLGGCSAESLRPLLVPEED